MSYLRFKMDMAVKRPIPAALQDRLHAIKERICELKEYCEKINEGHENEENTVRAKYHICHHDTGEPCEDEIEICVE